MVADVLDAAADLLTPEGAWTQDTVYRDRYGNPAGDTRGPAVCWCAVGAICEVNIGYAMKACEAAEVGLPVTAPGALRPLSAWNDDRARTQAEVIAKLREAAQLARQGQPA
ncbi:hypothetical protein GCM10011380_00230 [Sphingomonas metalli]|uniref:Uncharacterized protein n=1 Tax=Sphingomonas metalli TaxID=1779358 RepID=A0A916SV09_9SPHN|nr:hypothetical protein [Sphingomonas metalli]GGB14780.1 hypothetical protein GCM10011380_00230 [Sphingomonas metalli]